jgi:hypothetical protein
MRLRRAVLQISAKSSVPPRLPLHKSRSLPSPSQSTLPQLLIPRHFNSFSSNVYKKPRGRRPSADPGVCKLVIRHAPHLRAHTNTRNPNPLIHLLHGSLDTPGGGVSPFSATSAISALRSPSHSAATSARTRKPSPAPLPLLTTYCSLITPIFTSLLLYLVPLLKSVPPILQEPQCLKP